MGHLFEYHDHTIWAPNRDVALCFLAQVRHLEERLGVPSGLTEVMSDTIDIKPDLLQAFLRQIAHWANFDNNSIRLLLSGAVSHLLALLASCDPSVVEILEDYPKDIVCETRQLLLRVMKPIPLPIPPEEQAR